MHGLHAVHGVVLKGHTAVMQSSLKILVSRIVSGGQTGADRVALDWAIRNNVPHSGWCPRGRKAEDGTLDAKYLLQETESGGYLERTRQNVIDSDGTLIVNLGKLDGGTLATAKLARKLRKPHIVVQLDSGPGDEEVKQLMDWLKRESISTLNIAGPRESKRPGIYALTNDLLDLAADPEYRQRTGRI